MNKSQAETRIQSIFQRFSKASTLLHPTLLSGLNNGKLYELYVLSELVLDLDRRGFQVCLTQSNLKFKGRCCTARSKSLTSLCRLQSHPAQYVSGIPSAAILLSISHPIRCSTRCLANVRARISGPMIAL